MSSQDLLEQVALADYYDYDTFEVFLERGQPLIQAVLDHLQSLNLLTVEAALHGLKLEARPILAKALGRKKAARAKVTLHEGSGIIRINGIPRGQYFRAVPSKRRAFLKRLLDVPEVGDWLGQMDAYIQVRGSSPEHSGQIKAVAHALANALNLLDRPLGKRLEKLGYGGAKVQDDFED